jgi:hypothetical protein
MDRQTAAFLLPSQFIGSQGLAILLYVNKSDFEEPRPAIEYLICCHESQSWIFSFIKNLINGLIVLLLLLPDKIQRTPKMSVKNIPTQFF